MINRVMNHSRTSNNASSSGISSLSDNKSNGMFDPDAFKRKGLYSEWIVKGKFTDYVKDLTRNLDYWFELKAEEALLHYCIIEKTVLNDSGIGYTQVLVTLLTVAEIDVSRVRKMISPEQHEIDKIHIDDVFLPDSVIRFGENSDFDGYKLNLDLFDPIGKCTLNVKDLKISPAHCYIAALDPILDINNVQSLLTYYKLKNNYTVIKVEGDYVHEEIERRLRWIMRHKNSASEQYDDNKKENLRNKDARINALAKNFVRTDGLGQDKSWLYMYLDRYIYYNV